ncbi:signal peptidase I [Desulfitispora alkaliphila]|uniref:signal peptidase I n=1 Tax=Desulfitispora alkaliphila TaxID=622674 RepID=UPI003D20E2D0
MSSARSVFFEYVQSILIAVVLALLIRTFIFQPFYIPSGSMEPTLQVRDRIIVSKFYYRFTEPEIGDVLVFKYPVNESQDFIKRVVGRPGDVVELRDSQLYVNDIMIPESYIKEPHYGDFGPLEINAGEYFVLGDNRNNSKDSRDWGIVPEDNLVGKAHIIFWPLNRIGVIE